MPRTAFTLHRRPRGLTLVESMTVLLVAGVTLGATLPGLSQLREQRHLEGVAAQLVTDLAMARALAVAQDRGLRVRFRSDAGGSCYVVHSGAADACTCQPAGGVACAATAASFRSAHFPAGAPVTVKANVGSMLFHPALGTVTPTGTLRVVAASGATLHEVVNVMGRVRACSPNGVVGYPAC